MNLTASCLNLLYISLWSLDVCKNSSRTLSFQKNIYKWVLNPSKHSKIQQKSLKNPQNSQEPLSFAPRPSNHTKNSRITTEPPKKTILPLKAYNCLLHWIYLSIMCFTLGNLVPEPLFEDFQDEAFEESEVLFSGQQGKCPWSLRAYCFPMYSIVCRNCMIRVSLHAPMLETTRT
jgi:hypothetical protein